MALLFFQICKDKNLPRSMKIAKLRSKICQILNRPRENVQIVFKFLQKRPDFATSSPTGCCCHCSRCSCWCWCCSRRNKAWIHFLIFDSLETLETTETLFHELMSSAEDAAADFGQVSTSSSKFVFTFLVKKNEASCDGERWFKRLAARLS